MSKQDDESGSDWQIEPGVGVGLLRLGMNRDAVGGLSDRIGEVKRFFPDPSGKEPLHHLERREGGGPLCIYLDDTLVEIQLTEFTSLDIRFAGHELFGEPARDVCRLLVQHDPDAAWTDERLLLPGLALEATGFLMEIGPGGRPAFAGDVDWHQTRELVLYQDGLIDERAAGGRRIADLLR